MNCTVQFKVTRLNPSNPIELFQCLLCIGRSFTDHCWPNLEAVLNERLAIINAGDMDLARYTRLTFLTILLFFSYLDSTALSTKKLLLNAQKSRLLGSLSGKQQKLLEKADDRVSFEELMKIQFSILPHAMGIPVEYGTLKQHALPDILKLRTIRNRIVHPMGLEDIVGVDVRELDEKDINTPISDYMQQLSKILARCSIKLVPPENRHKIDLRAWLRTRQSSSANND